MCSLDRGKRVEGVNAKEMDEIVCVCVCQAIVEIKASHAAANLFVYNSGCYRITWRVKALRCAVQQSLQ